MVNQGRALYGIRGLSREADRMLDSLRLSTDAPQTGLEEEQEQLRKRTRSELLFVKRELGAAESRIAMAFGSTKET